MKIDDTLLTHSFAQQLLSRASGSERVPGNSVRILKDAKENYPAWLEAIQTASKTIHFESYIIYEDKIGKQFTALLAARAKEGVRVRLIYDWLGGVGRSSRRFWEGLRNSGVEVRCFNPVRPGSPLSWFIRDHRKILTVDGKIGFVSGLCVGQKWVGNPGRSVDPWRDTGVEMRGPAVAELDRAFAEVWDATGAPFPRAELRERASIPSEGKVSLRVVASVPTRAGLYRLDQLIAGVAQEYLWLTDAYFVGVTPYVQALRAAVKDGVDVRLLVPGATDIPVLQALSRMGYQPLLEAGIRIFEWNGSMLHSKTAVADRRWARVGSTNLNFSSWIGNYELDVAIEDEGFANAMEQMYLEDLSRSTEIVLGEHHRVRPVQRRERRLFHRSGRGSGSVSRVGAGAIRFGSAVGATVRNQKVHGPAGSKLMFGIGLFLLVIGATGIFWPRLVTVPLAVIFGWLGGSLLINAIRLHRARKKERGSDPP